MFVDKETFKLFAWVERFPITVDTIYFFTKLRRLLIYLDLW